MFHRTAFHSFLRIRGKKKNMSENIFGKILNTAKSAAGREESSRFGNAAMGRDRFAFETKKARAYLESALDSLATLAAFHNGDAAIAVNVANALESALAAIDGATLPEGYAAPAIRIGARVRIDPKSMAARYILNVDGMRTITAFDGEMLTLTGNVRIPASDVIPVK